MAFRDDSFRQRSMNASDAEQDADYNDAASAEELKNMGNKLFQAGDYRKAVRLYTRAIEQDGRNPALYSNRSAAYLLGSKQMAIDTRSMALRDADKTIKLKPTWFKGYSRRGDALFKLERYEEASQAYTTALEFDAGNAGILHSLNEVRPFLVKKKSIESGSWTLSSGNLDSNVTQFSGTKTTTKSAHELLDEFQSERLKTTPHLGLGGVDYKLKELERYRNRTETTTSGTSGTYNSAYSTDESPSQPPAQQQQQSSSSSFSSRRDVPSEFSSDAAKDYQAALLESYRKKKAEAAANRR